LLEYVRCARRLGLPRRTLVSVLVLSLVTTIAEGAGLAMVVPIYDFIAAGGEVALLPDTTYWRAIFYGLRSVDVELNLALLLAAAFSALVLRQALSYVRQMALVQAREVVVKAVRDRIFSAFIYASLSEQERIRPGDLINILTNELTRFNASLAGFVSLANAGVMLLLYSTLLFFSSWLLTLVAFAVVPLSLVPLRQIQSRTSSAGAVATQENRAATEFLVERIAPARFIRLSRREPVETSRMEALTSRQKDAVMAVERLMILNSVMVEPLILGMVFALIYLSIVVLALPIASLAIFLLVVIRLLPIAKDVVKGRQLMLSCGASTLALLQMLDRLGEMREGSGGTVTFTELQNSVCFKATRFRHSMAARDTLDGIDLEISAGTIVAIVGPSGAGKSTLFDLLPALRYPDSGDILFDGGSIRCFDIESLRQGIAFVPQQIQLYDSTIADHVRLGRADATDQDVEEAISLAGARSFVAELPEGIHTRLGQGGGKLSVGQRQRIDLARALVGKSSILLLDEPTSALDVNGEIALLDTLLNIRSKRRLTIIMITHRLPPVEYADHVVVLRAGRVEASGSLEEVSRSSSWFSKALSISPGVQVN